MKRPLATRRPDPVLLAMGLGRLVDVEDAGAMHGAAFEVAMAAGMDPACLPRVLVDVEEMEPWELVLESARVVAVRSREPDEERARHLASLTAAGIPAAEEAFAPRHARRAAELVERLVDTMAAGEAWAPVTGSEARAWLVTFEQHAGALA